MRISDWTSDVSSSVLLARLDARTRIVALPHCHWTDGGLLDLAAIRAACTSVGAALVIDATQSLGALPFDVAALDPDFLVAGGYKWLLGPYSFGYLYVAKRWQQAMPIEQNWIARKDSEDFAGLVDRSEEHTSELQSLMRISYAVFCLKKKKRHHIQNQQ